MECDHIEHAVLPNLANEFPRQECFIVTMKRPHFQAIAWEINNNFIRTDWMPTAPIELAEAVGTNAIAVVILPKFVLEKYEEAGVVDKTESLGEMDIYELSNYCSGVRQ